MLSQPYAGWTGTSSSIIWGWWEESWHPPAPQRTEGGRPHGNPLPRSWQRCFLSCKGLRWWQARGRHFRERVYRAPAKPQEVPAPGDEEQEEEEEEEEAKALSAPLHRHRQTKARALRCCFAEPCERQEGLNPFLLAVLSQRSSEGEGCQQKETKAPGKFIVLPPTSAIRAWPG